jgi:thiosulfate dehydrogenase
MKDNKGKCYAIGLAMLASAWTITAIADEFTKDELTRWEGEYMTVVKKGRSLFTDGSLGANGVVCAQCHPNAANTHPETYPKFQKQLGKVASMWEMVNWCIRNPLEGEDLAADDPRMTALLTYVTYERRGVKLEPGKH